MAKVPLGNAARTTRAVSSGTPSSDRGSSDISPHPSASDQALKKTNDEDLPGR
jgi:hypothetical protein